ncbi:MAG: hypothetical protein MdMp014T_1019 [Treponematales bacterium]
MRKSGLFILGTLAAALVCGFVLAGCGEKGGTLVVHNGTTTNYTVYTVVKIFFDDAEVFSGSLNTGETTRKTSDKDVEWKVVFSMFIHGQNNYELESWCPVRRGYGCL